jgi:hypothetical protein
MRPSLKRALCFALAVSPFVYLAVRAIVTASEALARAQGVH